MSEVTITIPSLAAMNLLDMIELRLSDIELLAKQHPLPMRDPETVRTYEAARKAIGDALVADAAAKLGVDLSAC